MNRAIGKYKCPCCGFYTFDEKLNGNYDICPVCFWEDDPIQLEDNEYEGGANRVSLIQARHNFLLFGACDLLVVFPISNLPPFCSEFNLPICKRKEESCF